MVALLTVVLLAAACGDDGARGTAGTTSTSTSTSTTASAGSSSGEVTHTVVQLLTQTGGGGAVSELAVPVPDVDAARAFVTQFHHSGLGDEVLGAVDVASVPAGQTLYAAVVAIGCDVPDQVEVARSGSGFRIDAVLVESPRPECFAPMTTVALVAIADG